MFTNNKRYCLLFEFKNYSNLYFPRAVCQLAYICDKTKYPSVFGQYCLVVVTLYFQMRTLLRSLKSVF